MPKINESREDLFVTSEVEHDVVHVLVPGILAISSAWPDCIGWILEPIQNLSIPTLLLGKIPWRPSPYSLDVQIFHVVRQRRVSVERRLEISATAVT